MKIKFKKEYDDGVTFTDVILDFMEYLGPAHYGYPIDEYDLLGIVWAARMKKLAPLVKRGNKPAENMYKECSNMLFKNRELGRELKEDYAVVLNTLMPKEKDLSERAEAVIDEFLSNNQELMNELGEND